MTKMILGRPAIAALFVIILRGAVCHRGALARMVVTRVRSMMGGSLAEEESLRKQPHRELLMIGFGARQTSRGSRNSTFPLFGQALAVLASLPLWFRSCSPRLPCSLGPCSTHSMTEYE